MNRILLCAVLACPMAWAAEDPLKDKGRPVATTQALPPAAAAKQFVVPEGFRVELIAGEPDLVQPVAFTVDDRGRIWLVENTNYPESPGRPCDRVLVLEDADGNGSYEKTTVFLTNATFTTGLAVGFGGVWLGSPPNLLFIPDADGDAVPDGEPQILLDGWAAEDTHETLNGFAWGPDGWLYGTHGVFTHSRVGRPGTPEDRRVTINAAVWRYHPTRRTFERWCEGGSNQWGIDWNDHGDAFFEACVIPHLWHAIQGARYQRQGGTHENPHSYDDLKTIAGGRYEKAAYCGAMVYLGGVFPAEWRDRFFFFDIHMNKLRCETLLREGSGYRGKPRVDFLYSPDAWFRGLSPQVAPDGSVLFNDWYDKVPCHQQRAFTDRGNGRIYRIVTDAVKPVRVDLTKATDAELVQMQLSENDWHVRHARRLLQERGAKPATVSALRQLLFRQADDTRQLRALWALHSLDALGEDAALRAMASTSEYVRGWAVTCASEDGRPSPRVRERMVRMAQFDPSPLVRLRLASAAQRMDPMERWAVVSALAAHGGDADDHNLPLMYWYAMEPALAADPLRGVHLLAEVQVPKVREFMARRLFHLAATQPETTRHAMPVFAYILGGADSGLRGDLLRGALAACPGGTSLPEPAGWADAYERLRADPKAEVRRMARTLSVVFNSAAALEELRALLASDGAGAEERGGALDTLAGRRDAAALDSILSVGSKSGSLRGRALRALAGYDDPRVAGLCVDQFPSLTEAERQDALTTLAARPANARAWLAAIDAGRMTSRTITAPFAQNLRGLRDAGIDAWLEKNWGSVRTSSEDTRKEIERYRKFLGEQAILRASATNGRAIYQRTCFVCHTMFGQGGKIGPELPGHFSDVDYLLQNILDPNAVIGKDFQQTFLRTRSGGVVPGVIEAEDERTVTLKTLAGPMTVARADIESRELSPLSMMPTGLLKPLSEQEVRDLFLYLRQGGDP